MNNVHNIEQLFRGRLFVVPDYQRGYAWDALQLREFLEDLDLLPRGKEHYTGTIILHELDGRERLDAEGKQYSVVDVVDGQQRLITIVLLLNAIRREAEDLGLKRLTSGITSLYIREEDRNGQPLFKLELNRDSNSFWIGSVLSDAHSAAGPRIQSHRRLADARRFFEEELRKRRSELGDRYETWLLDLQDKVTHRLRLSLYSVGDESDVGVVFEVTNDRGKPLTELEKVKNYLLYVAAKLDLEEHDLGLTVNEAWRNIFERLMAADLTSSSHEDQLLRAHWLMSRDYNKKNWDGTKSVKSRFSLRRYHGRNVELLADIKGYVKSLDEASVAYRDLEKPTHTDSFASLRHNQRVRDEAIKWTEKLRRIGATATFLPLLMAARLKSAEDGQLYLDAVRLCEAFAFRVYRLLGYRTYAAQSRLFRLGHRLYTGAIDPAETIRQIRGLITHYSPRSKFEDAFVLEEERSWYIWPGIRYFLYEYEDHLAKGKPVQLPWAVLEKRDLQNSIEHVLPQTPTDSYWLDRFDEDERESLTHDIGNLCLTYDNSSYGNRPFPEKKDHPGAGRACYAESNLFQERALCEFADWTPDAVLERRQSIVDWAATRWHVDEIVLDEQEFEAESEALESESAETEEDEAVEDEGLLAMDRPIRPKRLRRPRQEWNIDAYLDRGVPESAVNVLRELVRRLEVIVPDTWKVVFRKYEIYIRRDDGKLALWIGVSQRPRLTLVRSGNVATDPYPHLNGTRSPQGDWRWTIASIDAIPDVGTAVDLAKNL